MILKNSNGFYALGYGFIGHRDFISKQDRYEYTLQGTQIINGMLCYHLTFRPDRNKAKYVGELFINTDDFGLVYYKYELAPEKSDFKLNLKWMLGVKFNSFDNKMEVLMKKSPTGTYYPQLIKTYNASYVYVDRSLSFTENHPKRSERKKMKFNFLVEMITSTDDEIKNGSSPYVHRGADGKIEYIEAGVRNLATVETSGIDFVTAYNLETGIGDFNFRLDLTHVLDFKKQDNAESEMIDYAGLTDSPDWRGNFATSWKYDDFSAAWTVVYIGRQSADYYNQLEETDVYVDYSNYFKHNIQFAYNHAYNGSITVGVNNVFDADAPNFYTYADYRDVNVGLYDVLGRTYYLRINQKF